MNVQDWIAIAKIRMPQATMMDSAKLCLDESVKRSSEGNDLAALRWACKSLAYSVGIFSPEWAKLDTEIGDLEGSTIYTRVVEASL